jgi:hypothetical protein
VLSAAALARNQDIMWLCQINSYKCIRTLHLAKPQSTAVSDPERNVQTQFHELPTDNKTTEKSAAIVLKIE